MTTRSLTPWLPTLVWVGILFVLSEQTHLPGRSLLPVSDLVAHFVLYTVLGACLAWGRDRAGEKDAPGGRLPHAAVVATGILLGAVDEWHQSFVPRREPSLADLGADAVGVVVGYAALLLLMLARRASARA